MSAILLRVCTLHCHKPFMPGMQVYLTTPHHFTASSWLRLLSSSSPGRTSQLASISAPCCVDRTSLLCRRAVLGPPLRALHAGRQGSPRLEQLYRKRDGVPPDFQLVYVAPMERYVRAAGVAVLAPLLLAAGRLVADPVSAAAQWPPGGQTVTAAVLFTLLAAAVLAVVRRYPFRMYHSAAHRQFRAVLAGPLMVTSRHVTLAEGSVSAVDGVSELLPWKRALYRSEQGKLILLEQAFKSADAYNKLLGHTPEDDEGDDNSRP